MRIWACIEDPEVKAKGSVAGRISYALKFYPLVDLLSILPNWISFASFVLNPWFAADTFVESPNFTTAGRCALRSLSGWHATVISLVLGACHVPDIIPCQYAGPLSALFFSVYLGTKFHISLCSLLGLNSFDAMQNRQTCATVQG